jgi:hypothetical protein
MHMYTAQPHLASEILRFMLLPTGCYVCWSLRQAWMSGHLLILSNASCKHDKQLQQAAHTRLFVHIEMM